MVGDNTAPLNVYILKTSDNSLVLFYYIDLYISNVAMLLTKYVQMF